MKRLIVVAIALILTVAPAAQHYQSDFPPDEFRARWNRVFDVGSDALYCPIPKR